MPKSDRFSPALLACAVAGLTLITACRDSNTPSEAANVPGPPAAGVPQSDSGFMSGVFGSSDQPPSQADPGQLGVNTYLWRAALDTISFMPVASADPFGGVIITDWYSPPESPNERFKVNVFILDRQLRSDGIRATVFRQTQAQDGHWIDSPVDAKTATDFENSILTRARQLRIANVQPK
ncbi:MAG TPA: DUF3576 domain-containing protein [Stellaceae bacterium]|nr:DUF3576 domain-containing protein [Stellaceae bacterium]